MTLNPDGFLRCGSKIIRNHRIFSGTWGHKLFPVEGGGADHGRALLLRKEAAEGGAWREGFRMRYALLGVGSNSEVYIWVQGVKMLAKGLEDTVGLDYPPPFTSRLSPPPILKAIS